MIADTLLALALLEDPDDYPVVSQPQSLPGDPTPLYDALVAETSAASQTRAMCQDALKSRSPRERLLARALLDVWDDADEAVA